MAHLCSRQLCLVSLIAVQTPVWPASAAQALSISFGAVQDAAVVDTLTNPLGNIPDLMINTGNSSLGLVQFDVSAIPAGSVITDADLNLFHNLFPQIGITYHVFRNTSSWNEATVTYTTRPLIAPGPVASLTILDDNVLALRTWDVPGVVQGWVDGTFANFGFTVMRDPDAPDWAHFSSREAPTVTHRPSLNVDFQPVPEPATLLLVAIGLTRLSVPMRHRT